MKKVFGLIVIILIVVAVFLYRPQKIEEPQSTEWKKYSNPELGISFSYPPEWGEASVEYQRGHTFLLYFSKNQDVRGEFVETENVQDKCPTPKVIQNNYYCKLFTNDKDYLYESVHDTPEGLQQFFTTKNWRTVQFLPTTSLQSILDRTAPADILQKIDTFEKVMLTLEVK